MTLGTVGSSRLVRPLDHDTNRVVTSSDPILAGHWPDGESTLSSYGLTITHPLRGRRDAADRRERTVSAGILVVGASQAGLQLAVSLRDFGCTAPITLIGEEPH